MTEIRKFLLLIVLVAVLAVIGGSAFGITGGILGLLCALFIIAIIKRASLMFYIGISKYNKDMHEQGYRWMQRAYATTKLPPRMALTYAYLVIRDGRLSEGENLLNKISYLNKRDLSKEDKLNVGINRAIIIWKNEGVQKAIDFLEEFCKEGYKTTTLYSILGYLYLLDNSDKALDYNLQAYEYNSDNMVIEDNLANSYIAKGDFEKADEIYKRLLGQNPQFMEPYYNYGLLMERRGDFEKAKKYYEKALAFPEKYLSVIKHDDIQNAIESMENKTIKFNRVPSEPLASTEKENAVEENVGEDLSEFEN